MSDEFKIDAANLVIEDTDSLLEKRRRRSEEAREDIKAQLALIIQYIETDLSKERVTTHTTTLLPLLTALHTAFEEEII